MTSRLMFALLPPPGGIYDTILGVYIKMVAISSVFFGVFVLLAFATIVLLLYKGPRGRRPIQIQLVAAVSLLASMTVFYLCNWGYVEGSVDLEYGTAMLLGDGPVQDVIRRQGIMTVMLTINVFISDSVVWWRASAIWAHNKLVLALASLILTATFVCGLLSAVPLLTSGVRNIIFIQADFIATGSLYMGDRAGTAALGLSLASNVATVLLIAFKAWTHRRMLKKQLGSAAHSTQVLSVLALLVESGMAYSMFWITVLVVTLSELDAISWDVHTSVAIFATGCIVPLVASYPLAVILLVAASNERLERGQPVILMSFHATVVRSEETSVPSRAMTYSPVPSGHTGPIASVLPVLHIHKTSSGDGNYFGNGSSYSTVV